MTTQNLINLALETIKEEVAKGNADSIHSLLMGMDEKSVLDLIPSHKRPSPQSKYEVTIVRTTYASATTIVTADDQFSAYSIALETIEDDEFINFENHPHSYTNEEAKKIKEQSKNDSEFNISFTIYEYNQQTKETK